MSRSNNIKQRQIIGEWQFLLGKTTNTTYLGKIRSRWNVVKRGGDFVRITLYKEKLLRSIVCSVFLIVFITIMVFTKGVHSNTLWLFGIPAIWLLIGLRFGYRKELMWKKNTNKILFLSGCYLFTKKVTINRTSIFAKLKYSIKSHGNRKETVISLYNTEYPNTCLRLVSSVKHSWIIPVADSLKEILSGNFEDETG